jgi:hypothetical protein
MRIPLKLLILICRLPLFQDEKEEREKSIFIKVPLTGEAGANFKQVCTF